MRNQVSELAEKYDQYTKRHPIRALAVVVALLLGFMLTPVVSAASPLEGNAAGAPYWLWIVVVGLIVVLIGWKGLTETRQKNGAYVVGVAMILIALALGPLLGLLMVTEPAGGAPCPLTGNPTTTPCTPVYEIQTIAEASLYNFPDFSTDNDVATGSTEIVIDNNLKEITIEIVLDNSANSVAPDSWAITATVRRRDIGYLSAGNLVAGTVSASWSFTNADTKGWTYLNGTTINVVEWNSQQIPQYTWEDFSAGVVGVGVYDAATIGTLAPGASDTADFNMYFNEDTLLTDLGGNALGLWGSTSNTKTVKGAMTIAGVTINVTFNLNWQA